MQSLIQAQAPFSSLRSKPTVIFSHLHWHFGHAKDDVMNARVIGRVWTVWRRHGNEDGNLELCRWLECQWVLALYCGVGREEGRG